ncbi:MAG: penicillin acylase family protein [Planctomycetia bacterium]|nr:penicillin acylase family protein [Planctomycetia bacterium]
MAGAAPVVAQAPSPIAGQPTAATSSALLDAAALAQHVTIHRDAFGVPHVDGADDAATVFGFAYAQAEDNFWQIEDSYILGLGRYAEVHGPRGLNSDLLNRAFEIVPRSKADYETLPPEHKRLAIAFVEGLNYYLSTHPEEKPRLIRQFEPWQTLAYGRQLMLEITYRYTRRSNSYAPRMHRAPFTQSGSNAWAIGPERTASGYAILVVNPHQPWFGFGQLYEAHLRSGEGWSFSGATTLGSILPSLGHNDHLGWALTTNEPDIADVWIETFDDPENPLRYCYGDGHRQAAQWTETVLVGTASGAQKQEHTFRKTHHGPIVEKLDDKHFLSARISGLFESRFQRQALAMIRSQNFEQFRAALSLRQFPLMNVTYADRDGNIAMFYNGFIPRRDATFDWSKPVDGSDPKTEWQGWHELNELPAVINPKSHYVQNCNSSPFTTTDGDNPDPAKFPGYMIEDRNADRLRARMSRQILSQMQGATLEDVQAAVFDTKVYWAQAEFPRYAVDFARLKREDAKLAAQVEPYWRHLESWDYRVTEESTQATLCEAWHRELHQGVYPAESLKPRYAAADDQFRALLRAAAALALQHGTWRVVWGEVHRIQRHADVADLIAVPFDDKQASLPCLGVPGPMGAIFTQYYTPPATIPFVRSTKRSYGVVGNTYLAVLEFGPKVRGATLLPFGQSGAAASPHFFDQAPLLSQRKLKPERFDWADVLADARRSYHPGPVPMPAPAVAP